MADAPVSPVNAQPAASVGPDDGASGDALEQGLRAARDTPPGPGAEDIAADDAGGSALAEKLGAQKMDGAAKKG